MKIISNNEYDQMKIKEKLLVEAIDRALMLLGNIDKNNFSCDSIGVEGNYYFWRAMGTLKGSLHDYSPRHEGEWIEP